MRICSNFEKNSQRMLIRISCISSHVKKTNKSICRYRTDAWKFFTNTPYDGIIQQVKRVWGLTSLSASHRSSPGFIEINPEDLSSCKIQNAGFILYQQMDSVNVKSGWFRKKYRILLWKIILSYGTQKIFLYVQTAFSRCNRLKPFLDFLHNI